MSDIKQPETFHSNFEVWESRYRDPRYLSRLDPGQFGSEVELGLHDWLHMRWASVPRDPSNGAPVPYARDPADFSERWYAPENDFLGDPFSSHVNPVFWCFHGWIDDRLEDWYRAHQRFHPGEVTCVDVSGVPVCAGPLGGSGRSLAGAHHPWLQHTPGLAEGKTVEMDPGDHEAGVTYYFR